MKRLSILLATALLLGCLSGCAVLSKPNSAKENAPVSRPETLAPNDPAETDPPVIETDAPGLSADALPDFTVDTVTGGTFHLHDEVKTHDLVLINLFATWCGPCRMEFPYLEEAWEQERDRVSVIALSIEPTDTADVLRDFAEDLGLNFPVAREDGTDLSRFVTEGIPTTLIVDRTGRVAAVEVGAKTSAAAFLDLFDDYTGIGYDAGTCIYTVLAYDSYTGMGVEGLVVNFCTDTTCTPVTTSDEGSAFFTGAPAKYHVQVVQAPDGWEVLGETDFYTETYGQTFWIPLQSIG